MTPHDPLLDRMVIGPPSRTALIDELRYIEDELVYIIECLLQDLTGESKSQISGLARHVESVPVLPAAVSKHIATRLRHFREHLVLSVVEAPLTNDIAVLRRSIANAVAIVGGRCPKYHLADPLLPENMEFATPSTRT